MSNVIHLKENETLQEQFNLLQNTLYKGIAKTEILRNLIAEKSWLIQQQLQNNHSIANFKASYNPNLFDSELEKIRKFAKKALSTENIQIDKLNDDEIQTLLKSL